MAEKSGFFNALMIDGEYDRKYNANDYSENLAVVIGNGVLRSVADDLRVTASGMACTVAAGRAWINGKWYYNDAPRSFAPVAAPAGGSRWDRVMLRLNTSVAGRNISLVYVQGAAANTPVKPEPFRNADIYDLVLADVYVPANATSVVVTDKRADASVCGWVYSTAGDKSFFTSLDNDYNAWSKVVKDDLASVTLFKRYAWRTVTDGLTGTLGFNVPQWDEETCMLDVYVNGIRIVEGVDFTRIGKMLQFTNLLANGTEVDVLVYKSIDGTGIMSVADEITELQNQVASLNAAGDYAYVCNGYDDNVQLARIVDDWLNDEDHTSMTIHVYGQFGAQAPVGGDGDFLSPYYWIKVGGDYYVDRKITFDFSCCSELNIPVIAGVPNYIFYGIDAHIIGADVYAYEKTAGTGIIGFSTIAGSVHAENCRFWLTGYNNCKVACNGTFTNCFASVANSTGESYCFAPLSDSLVRLNGGTYMAYSGSASIVSAVVGHVASSKEAVSILNGVNAPTIGRGGYYQTHSIYQYTGGGVVNCRDLVSALPISAIGTNNISGTITKSKPNA